jgi:hypothetical protein
VRAVHFNECVDMILNSLHIKELECINSIIFQAVRVGNPLIYLLIDQSSLYACVIFPGFSAGRR